MALLTDEQIEQMKRSVAKIEAAMSERDEHMREEGRREILREIAELMARRHSGPWEYDEHCCVFDPKRDDRVSPSWSGGCSHPDHAPNCLWVRAQIARPEGAGDE